MQPRPLLMRLFSLAGATLVTWRLNRALTFDRSGRHQHDEAMRYAIVTAAGAGHQLCGVRRAGADACSARCRRPRW